MGTAKHSRKKKQSKVCMILMANTVIDPRTVMVCKNGNYQGTW